MTKGVTISDHLAERYYKQGVSDKEIADKLNCYYKSVARWRYKRGFPSNSKGGRPKKGETSMKTNPSPRSYGTKLLESKSNQEKVESPVTTRLFDVDHLERTGELKYLYEEGETVTKVDQIENAKRMREEVTTLDQFNSIGNTKDVAKKYEISMGTAHGLKLSLKAKKAREEAGKILEAQKSEKIEPLHTQELKDEFKIIIVKCEKALSEDLGTAITGELDQDSQLPQDVTEEPCYLLDGETIDLPDEDTERVISDLEEHWTKPNIDIEEQWKLIKSGIRTLHKMHLNRAEIEFQERLAGVIEEC